MKNKLIHYLELEPSQFFIDGHKIELDVYKNIPYRNNQDKFKIDLMYQMLNWDPNKRATAYNLLQHPFFTNYSLTERISTPEYSSEIQSTSKTGIKKYTNNKGNTKKSEKTEDDSINKLLNEMTEYEINCIMTMTYKDLWSMIHKLPCPFRYEKTFNKIIKNIKSKYYNISNNRYRTPEWEFPKGKKKDDNESDIETAKREFKEETNLNDDDFIVYDNIKPIVENYTGTDGYFYSYFYYIALIKPSVNITTNKTFETDKIGFYSYDTAFSNIRPYNTERKQILKCVFDDIVNWINKKYNITINY